MYRELQIARISGRIYAFNMYRPCVKLENRTVCKHVLNVFRFCAIVKRFRRFFMLTTGDPGVPFNGVDGPGDCCWPLELLDIDRFPLFLYACNTTKRKSPFSVTIHNKVSTFSCSVNKNIKGAK